jgi:hypothetical protein
VLHIARSFGGVVAVDRYYGITLELKSVHQRVYAVVAVTTSRWDDTIVSRQDILGYQNEKWCEQYTIDDKNRAIRPFDPIDINDLATTSITTNDRNEAMTNPTPTTCTCGRQAMNAQTRCSTCHDRQLKRHSRLSLSQQDRSQLTLPPDSVPSSRNANRKSVNVTLNKAFASEEEEPALFPPTFYRDRTPSRPSTKGSPIRSSESPTQRGCESLSVSDPTRDRSYSPMAAAFARLNVKDEAGARPGSSGRSGSGRASVDFDARRLFMGSA